MTDDRVTMLHGCELPHNYPDEDPTMSAGHWERTDCAGYSEAMAAAGGYDALCVWSSLTDLDGQYGTPKLFMCWGEKGGDPVAADGGTVEQWKQKPCAMDHVVWRRG